MAGTDPIGRRGAAVALPGVSLSLLSASGSVGHGRFLHLGGRPWRPLSGKACRLARMRPREFNRKWAEIYKSRGGREEVGRHERATCHPGEKRLCGKGRLSSTAPRGRTARRVVRSWRADPGRRGAGQQGEEEQGPAGVQGRAGRAAVTPAALGLEAAAKGLQGGAQGAVAAGGTAGGISRGTWGHSDVGRQRRSATQGGAAKQGGAGP